MVAQRGFRKQLDVHGLSGGAGILACRRLFSRRALGRKIVEAGKETKI